MADTGAQAGEVAFTVRADEHGGKRLVRLEGVGFVRRFLLHVLPTGSNAFAIAGCWHQAARQLS